MEMRKIETTDAMPIDAPAARTGIARWRKPLMLAVPLLILAAGAYLWLTGGRYVSTDNAYTQADKVSVSSDVTGRIVQVAVRENQHVNAGDLLFRIDPEPFRIALAQADAAVASARLQVSQLRATYSERGTDIGAARADLVYAQSEFDRQAKLLDDGFTTRARYDAARAALEAARQHVAGAQASSANASAALGGNLGGAVDSHPLVRSALAQRAQAALNLERSTVRAPQAGTVSQSDRLQVGGIMAQGVPAVSIVVGDRVWIEANFKETDLQNMRVGQPATIELDAYPERELRARVASIGAGTGSEFSVLPAQNATGNWVKVTQRVPVRLTLLDRAPGDLIAGLSTKVTVDTGER